MRVHSPASARILALLSLALVALAPPAAAQEADASAAIDIACTPDRIEVPWWYCISSGPCGFGCHEVCLDAYSDYGNEKESTCVDTTGLDLDATSSAATNIACSPDRIEVPWWYCISSGPCGFGCYEVCVDRYDDYGREKESECLSTLLLGPVLPGGTEIAAV